MKYTINGFSQSELVKKKLDAVDSLLLRYFIDFKDSGKMVKKIVDNEIYYWLDYDTIIRALPILNLNKPDSIYRRFKKMCACNILKSQTIRNGGTYSYYTTGPEYINLIDSRESRTSIDNADTNPTISDRNPRSTDENPNMTDTNPKFSDEKPELIDSSININLIDSSITIYNSIITYLNEKAKTTYRASSKKTQSLIHARLNEGFKPENFTTVIDKKCLEWMGTEFEKYLRPETLFGTKFESYLNQQVKENKQVINKPNITNQKPSNFNNYEQRNYDYDALEKKLLGWDK